MGHEYSGDTSVSYLLFLGGDRQIEVIGSFCEEYDIPVSD